ncbi:MAG: hypothetical protein O2854_03925 [Chloroflexi bacterium]|nr:hypothetical protein [Chloroflexota bacterium]
MVMPKLGIRFLVLAIAVAAIGIFVAACGGSSVPDCNPGEICTIAGTGIAGRAPEDLPALESDLYLPFDVEFGPDGRMYLLDWNNHRIRAFLPDGKLETVAGAEGLGDGPEGPALQHAFNHPTHIVFDDQGRMVIAAWHNSRIKRFDMKTGMVEDIAGTGARFYSGDGGPAKTAELDLPAAVVFDKAGNLYVMDQANQVIRVIDTNGIITRFAGQCLVGEEQGIKTAEMLGESNKLGWNEEDKTSACNAAFSGDGGPALDARMWQQVGQAAEPAGGMAVDDAGNIYFSDSGNHRIRKIDTNGIVTSVAGNGTRGYEGDGGLAINAQLNRPNDIHIGPDGTLYIADTYNHCVRAVGTDGVITTAAGTCGSRGFSGDGGDPTLALLDRPYGVCVDSAGNLYVADTYNHRVRMVMAAGNQTS